MRSWGGFLGALDGIIADEVKLLQEKLRFCLKKKEEEEVSSKDC